ncbi:hypothetical protein SUGI_0490380 [Cryptomeria japonica]|uniref:cytochrome P450 716B1-like n=1 Tax=Cryptomeria japonica TaxID=3369 RepID=UPI002408E332|nr:cytochrome P450 716B1-like [Cryptomeria japonica]GLJ25597.1 hypothetical protein SUGI_0490380 [Cryptomeria japonica]
MEYSVQSIPLILIACSSFLAFILCVLIAKTLQPGKQKSLPPGNLGLPLLGQTIEFLRAHKSNTSKDWIEEKVKKYGPVFKTSLMGCPTVVLTGQAGNRFVFQSDDSTITNKQPISLSRIIGKKNILELTGEDHKRMRGAIMQFLKPEALQKLVGRMDSVIQQHFLDCWEGKEFITVLPLMKTITFQIACDLLFSLTDTKERQILGTDFTEAMKGVWSFPLDLPGTTFRSGLNARSRICKRLTSLLQVRRGELQQEKSSPDQDLMSTMLTMRDENGGALTEEDIIDNMIAVMAAGHESTCTLLVHLVRLLALNPDIYQNIMQEQRHILLRKNPSEHLQWVDVQKMKYTWKVAQETLRLIPPAFGGFRKVMKDIEFGGYAIPKGWQLFWAASSTHMDEEIFTEPNKFDPSHFSTRLPPYTFIPFGGGHRICPGYDFTKMEIVIYLHHLVLNYKWSLMDPKEKIECEPMPLPAMGLPIKLEAMHE